MVPQVKLEGTVSVNVTVPPKPLMAAMAIVEVAVVPAWTVAGELAAIVKSWNVKVAVAECDRLPFVPVIVTT